jgi:hypothetical protein
LKGLETVGGGLIEAIWKCGFDSDLKIIEICKIF